MFVERTVVQVPSSLNLHVENHIFDVDRESVILVNGALSTTASFRKTVKYLSARYNVICFDLPYAGQSRPLNGDTNFLLTKEDEVDILLHLIHRFKPKFLYSVSWGGLASLLALAREPSSIKRAVIGSFSPFLNPAMVDYVTRARAHIHAGENLQAAQLLNDTVGKHLPRMLKHTNYMYLTSLPETEQKQVAFHVEQILALQPESYMHCLSSIQSKVKFINGDLDEYTTSADIRTLGRYIPDAEFETVANTGHFLELEGREQAAAMQEALMDFFGGGQRWDHPVMPQPIVTPALMRSAAVANYEAVQ